MSPVFCGDRACLAPYPGHHTALQSWQLGDPGRVVGARPWVWPDPPAYPRCSQSCCGAGIAGVRVKHCRRSTTPAATRPGPSGAPSVRSCFFQGAVAAMGPARTPLLRPAWLVAFLDRPKTPNEAPRTPACLDSEAQRGHHQKSGTDVQQRLECGSKTAPHCPHIP